MPLLYAAIERHYAMMRAMPAAYARYLILIEDYCFSDFFDDQISDARLFAICQRPAPPRFTTIYNVIHIDTA